LLVQLNSGSEAGSYLRCIDSCITQLKAQGPSRTCNESKEEVQLNQKRGPRSHGAHRGQRRMLLSLSFSLSFSQSIRGAREDAPVPPRIGAPLQVHCYLFPGLGFRIWASGGWVQDLGFRVWGLGFRVQGSRVQTAWVRTLDGPASETLASVRRKALRGKFYLIRGNISRGIVNLRRPPILSDTT